MNNDASIKDRLLDLQSKLVGCHLAAVRGLSPSFRVKNCLVKEKICVSSFFRDDLDDFRFCLCELHLFQVEKLCFCKSRGYLVEIHCSHPPPPPGRGGRGSQRGLSECRFALRRWRKPTMSSLRLEACGCTGRGSLNRKDGS